MITPIPMNPGGIPPIKPGPNPNNVDRLTQLGGKLIETAGKVFAIGVSYKEIRAGVNEHYTRENTNFEKLWAAKKTAEKGLMGPEEYMAISCQYNEPLAATRSFMRKTRNLLPPNHRLDDHSEVLTWSLPAPGFDKEGFAISKKDVKTCFRKQVRRMTQVNDPENPQFWSTSASKSQGVGPKLSDKASKGKGTSSSFYEVDEKEITSTPEEVNLLADQRGIQTNPNQLEESQIDSSQLCDQTVLDQKDLQIDGLDDSITLQLNQQNYRIPTWELSNENTLELTPENTEMYTKNQVIPNQEECLLNIRQSADEILVNSQADQPSLQFPFYKTHSLFASASAMKNPQETQNLADGIGTRELYKAPIRKNPSPFTGFITSALSLTLFYTIFYTIGLPLAEKGSQHFRRWLNIPDPKTSDTGVNLANQTAAADILMKYNRNELTYDQSKLLLRNLNVLTLEETEMALKVSQPEIKQ